MAKRYNVGALNLIIFCYGLAMYSLYSKIQQTRWLIAPPVYVLLMMSLLAFFLGMFGFKDLRNWRTKTRSWLTVIFSAFLSIVLFLASLLLVFASSLGVNERIETSHSPNGKYTVDFYRYDPGATGAYGVRGELNGPLWYKKRIYHQSRIEQVEVEWVDNDIILINKHKLNLKAGETYGY